jgi:UPF0716 family protein affecting phage T7 exclusion
MSSYVDLAALRNVFLVALLAGVGITVLFSVGVRSLTRADEAAEAGRAATGHRVLAAASLVVVAAAVAVGLWAVLAK